MAIDPITAWEDAIISRCDTALRVDDKRLVRAVESLPGDWDDDMLRRLLRLVPGCFVAFAGGAARAGATAEVTARWIVYVVTGHASGEAARRRGDAQEAGAYSLISLLMTALHGWAADSNSNALSVVEVSNLYTGTIDRQGVAVYALTFEAPLAFEALQASDLGDFALFEANLDVPPFSPTEVQRLWLDKNDELGGPDSRDEVSLPTA